MTQWRHLFSFEIFMEKGYIASNGLKTSSNTYGKEVISIAKNRTQAPTATWTEEERYTYPVNTSWEREMGIFVDCIRQGADIPTCGIEEAVDLMRMVDKVYKP